MISAFLYVFLVFIYIIKMLSTAGLGSAWVNYIIIKYIKLQLLEICAFLMGDPKCKRHKWSRKVLENNPQCSACTLFMELELLDYLVDLY